MASALDDLYKDPEFQDLAYEDQLRVLRRVVPSRLGRDPEFLSLDNYNQNLVLQKVLTAPVPALKDKGLEEELRQMRSEAFDRDKPMTPEEMEAAARNPEFARKQDGMGPARKYIWVDEMIRNNVGVQWATKYFLGPAAEALGMKDFPLSYEALYGEDKRKANQFVKNLLGSTGDTPGQALGVSGSVIGTLADWLLVAKLQAPLVKPIAAYGISKLSPKLLQMFPKVNARGLMTAAEVVMPQAVDAVIDGIINIPRAETLAELNREPTPSSQGIGEIAKQFGIGAAFDFGVGTALSYAMLTPRLFKTIFRKSPSLKGGLEDANLDDAITRMVNGVLPDERWNLLNPKQQAFARQQSEIYRYLKNSTDAPETLAMGRLHLLAQDTGAIVDTAGGKWDIYVPNVDGGFDLRNFQSYTESLDFLSDNLYLQAKKMGIKKREGLFEADGWAWDYSQTRRLPVDTTEDLRKGNIKGAPLSETGDTIVMAPSEADFLIRNSSPGGAQAVKVDADLDDFANKINLKQVPFKGGVDVAPNPTGNSVALFRKVAPQAEYDAAGILAKKASALNPGIDLEEYRRIYLLSNGYDAYANPDGTLKLLSEFSVKPLIPEEALTPGKALKKSLGNTFEGHAYVDSTVSKVLRGREFIENPRAVSDTLYRLSRNINEGDAKKLTSAFLYDTPISEKDIRVRVLKRDNDAPNGRGVMVWMVKDLKTGAPQIEVLLPRKLTSQIHEKRFIQDYMASLKKLVKDLGPDVKKMPSTEAVLRASPVRWELPKRVDINPKSWVEAVVNEFGGSYRVGDAGEHLVRFHGMKEPRAFKEWDEVTDFVARYTVTPEVLKEDLMLQGIRLNRNRDGIYRAVGPGLDGPVEAQSVPQMMEKLNYFPDRLDVRFGPKEAILLDEGVFIEERGLNVMGSRKKVLQMLDKFEDKMAKAQSVLIEDTPNGPIFKQPDSTFLVNIPEYKYGKVFDNPKDAKEFIKKFDSFEVLSEVADQKGFYLKLNSQGEFVLYGNGSKYLVKDYDSLKKVFTDYPTAESGMPSIFATTIPEADIQAQDILKLYKRTQFPESVPIRWGLPDVLPEDVPAIDAWTHFKAMTSRTTKWMEDYARKVDGSFLPLFREIELGVKASNVESSHALRTLDTMFSENGKRIPKLRRREIFNYLGALEDGMDGADFMKKSGFKELNPREVKLVEDIRKYYNALGHKFGIKMQDWIGNYRSRILDWHSSSNKKIVNEMENAGEMLEAIFGKERVGKEISAFFENARVSDVLAFAAKDDIMEVLTQYTMTGMKKYHLQDSWNKISTYISQNAGQLERTGFTARINHYREAVMGYTKTSAERHISELGRKTADAMYNHAIFRGPLKLAGVTREDFMKVGENVFGVLQSMQSLSALGFKPALAIRNSTQIYTMLGSRVGLERVHKATKSLLDGGDETLKYLRNMGVISDAPPIVNEIYMGEGKLAKLQELGLSWFKNSDDFTRGVAYIVGGDYIDNALRMKSQVPGILDNQLAQVAGLDLIPPDMRNTILGLLKKNTDMDTRSAKMLLGEYWSSSTMFSYNKADSPMMFKGFLGKMYGQFGTYSAGYRAVVSDGVRYGGAAFIGRFLAINTALWGATHALGMKFNDYIPMMPALFSGGPLFDTGVAVMQGMDPSYQGAQARKEALEGVARMFPGTAQLHYLKKAGEHAANGNPWKAFLSLTSTSTRND